MSTLQVELVSPERVGFSGEAKMVTARTTSGDIAFLPGHVPFIGVLTTHGVRVTLLDGSTFPIAVHQGFVEVSPPDAEGVTRVTILSDVSEMHDAIDVPRAKRALDRATHILAADPDDEEAKAALRRAEVRLEAAGAIPNGTIHSDH
jgi:F-type H+-transporting ATPase subunit epsilon